MWWLQSGHHVVNFFHVVGISVCIQDMDQNDIYWPWGGTKGPWLCLMITASTTLYDPIDSSVLGSPIPGILQPKTLEWVAISFSNAWKWKVKVKLLSHVRLLATPWTTAYQAPLSMGFARQEYWSGVPLPSPPSPSEKYIMLFLHKKY